MTCTTCKYIHLEVPHPENPVYKCRRFPPAHDFTAGYPNRVGLFPSVKTTYFCGEYAPKSAVLSADIEPDPVDSERVVRQRGRPKKVA